MILSVNQIQKLKNFEAYLTSVNKSKLHLLIYLSGKRNTLLEGSKF